MLLSLTKPERDKVVAWLEQEARTEFSLIEQMKKLNTPSFLVDKRKLEATAYMIIAKRLKDTEDAIL